MLLLKMSRTICSMSNWSHCFCMWKDVLVVHNERMLWHQSISSILEWFPSQRASNAAPLSKDKNSPSLLCCRGLAEEGLFSPSLLCITAQIPLYLDITAVLHLLSKRAHSMKALLFGRFRFAQVIIGNFSLLILSNAVNGMQILI